MRDNINEGDVVVTVARDGARMGGRRGVFMRPIWTAAAYRAQRRQSDGALTWRRDDNLLGAALAAVPTRCSSAPSRRFLSEVEAAAERDGLPFTACYIRHGVAAPCEVAA